MIRRTRTLLAIAFGLASVVAAAGAQEAPGGPLSAELRAHVKDDRFAIITGVRGLPLGVRESLQTLFGSRTLDIAEPGAEFQATEARTSPALPIRRLIAAGCAADHHCLVYYERGGGARTFRVALFHWSPESTRFEWGALASGGLTTIEQVQKAVLSGAAKGETTVW